MIVKNKKKKQKKVAQPTEADEQDKAGDENEQQT